MAEQQVPELDSSSGRIKVASLAILAVSAIAKVYFEAHPGVLVFLAEYTFKFVPHLLDLLLDALLIATIIAYLSETKLLKNYFERRIQRLTSQSREAIQKRFDEALRTDFMSRVENVEYLRQFDEELLKRAESAIRRAFFVKNLPPEVEAFLGALSSLRETLTVWRTNYRMVGIYEDVPNRADVYISDGQAARDRMIRQLLMLRMAGDHDLVELSVRAVGNLRGALREL